MSFLDDIRSRLPFGGNHGDDYVDDDYDEFYDDDEFGSEPYDDYAAQPEVRGQHHRQDSGNGMLGQTRRGEAESVAVYTRSGQLVGDADRHASTFAPPSRDGSVRPGAYDTASSYAQSQQRAAMTSQVPPVSETDARVSAITSATAQLPAYILRPESYDDVETVVRRVRTRQPVALVFAGVRTEVAKRVLDFSYGFACGLGASVHEVGDRVFMVLPVGCDVRQSDLAKLRQDGYLK